MAAYARKAESAIKESGQVYPGHGEQQTRGLLARFGTPTGYIRLSTRH